MSDFRILIILFLTFSLLQAKTYNRNDIIDLYNFENWKVAGFADIEQSKLPLYSDTADTISLTNSFNFNNDSLNGDLYFKSFGVHGLVSVFVNGHLISKQLNHSAPFRVKVNKNYLKSDSSTNTINFIITREKNFETGFPVSTHLYSEPEFIGITRPFFLEIVKKPLFSDFEYSLEKENNEIFINYNYRTSQKAIQDIKNKSGISFEEIFSDSSGRIISKRTIPASSRTTVISNKKTFQISNLWTIENPKFVNFSISLKRFGQTISTQKAKIAIRNIESYKNELYINFEKAKINGINVYENLIAQKSSNLFSDIKQRMMLIKNDGFNAVRFYGHIPDERYFSIADTLGLLLFIDLPIRRYPEIVFQKDALLENLKMSISTTVNNLKSHPSFVALGIGQEVLLSNPSTKKFYIILNGATEKPIPFLTYISPVPQNNISKEMAADFYMLDVYDAVFRKVETVVETGIPYALSGKTGFNSDLNYLDHDNPNYAVQQKLLLKTDVKAVLKTLKMQGGFIESFMDWSAKKQSHQNMNEKNKIIRNGFYDSGMTKYDWAKSQINIWDNDELLSLEIEQEKKSSNIFSIVMLFGSLIFFFFYRRYPRFSENYKRALKHPYGFYVDMRERRIIPIFNSFMLGVHNSLILSVFIGSFVFFGSDLLLIQEIMNVLIARSDIYATYLTISNNELLILPFLFILLFLHPLMMGIILKLLGMISKNYVRFRQAIVIGLWSSAPLIFMLPLSFAAYHLLVNNLFVTPMLIIFALFLIWSHVRLINGIRVLVLAKFRVIFLVLLLSYTIPLVIFGFFFIPQPMWYDYLTTLLNSSALF
ncbi:MAG: hypothetical protein D8M58_02410 [Calditrichaeota bacterium]|nr:MAG: hypothetical protein DWQ03_04670 [Calditrichota bacterium]MBL1204217.1 hypothetical protein [Calditrichota bacterium]NOG44047.1 hypothetical protein [Calditrichota bacterium]